MDQTTWKLMIDRWLSSELERVWLITERRVQKLHAAGFAGIPKPLLDVFEARNARRELTMEAALAAHVAELPVLRSRSPLAAVVRRLGLTPLELDVLMLTIAPLIDPALADVFQMLRWGTPRRGVDLALISDLLELARAQRLELLDAISADRPLIRWNLLRTDAPRDQTLSVHRALVVSPDVVSTLCGSAQLPSALVRHAKLVRGRDDLDGLALSPTLHHELTTTMASIRSADNKATLPWFVVWGGHGSGRRQLATRLAAAAKSSAILFDPTTCSSEQVVPCLRELQREALVRGAVLVVGPIDATQSALTASLQRYPGPVILVVTSMAPPRLTLNRPRHEIALTTLGPDEAGMRWSRALARVGAADVDVTTIIDGFVLTAGEIDEASAHAAARAAAHGRTPALADVRCGVELCLRAQLGDVVERVDATERFEDIVLNAEEAERLIEFINRKRFAARVYQQWGVGRRIRYGKGMIALFSGEPGTGKTMLAGVIANELGLSLYRVDLSQVVSKWAGESEKQLARVFDIAERTQAVLLFDEADSLFGKRGEIEGGRDRYANLTVNYLLQRLEQYPGVAVLTTNKESALDAALQRRLSLHLRLEVPEARERERLWSSFLVADVPGADTIDVRWLAERYRLTGGSIKNAAVRATFLAAADCGRVSLDLVVTAVERELDDMGRVVCEAAYA